MSFLLFAPPLPGTDHTRIARYLSTHGPTPSDTLAVALGLEVKEVRVLTCYPWFRITGSGWALTRRGRDEAYLN